METEDRHRGKRYSQTFTDNMSLKSEPKLRKLKPHKNTRRDWTKVTFKPDLERCAAALPARNRVCRGRALMPCAGLE